MKSQQTVRRPIVGAGLLFIVLLLAGFASASAQTAPSGDYRDPSWVSSRNLIWVISQVHLLFGGFVLGVPIFAWICEIVGVWSKDVRYDRLAREFTRLVTACFEMTATLGIIFVFSLRVLYPKLWNFLTGIFLPSYYIYLLLFLAEGVCLYIYAAKWDSMQTRLLKGIHVFTGFMLNIFGAFIMFVPSSWASFQASPVVLTATGLTPWERAWAAMNNPTWWPVNVHRVVANVVLGGFVCGAYAGVRYLGATTREEREHYDWMGYVGNFVGIFGLLPLPFAGYWLMREVYQYNQQMGITLMGGILSWLFILQAVLIGTLFLGANYYLWQGLVTRTGEGAKYKPYILIMLFTILACLGVWMTPHSLVASLQEARAMGGTHHPILGVFGVMSAKLTVVNIIILTSFISFLLYWRANLKVTVVWGRAARIFEAVLFTAAIVGVVLLGIYGYFVPAIYRVNVLSVAQVLAVLFVLGLVTPMTGMMLRGAKMTGKMTWGIMKPSSQYALVINAVTVVLTMSLMGYARSASRVHWHVYGVMEDTTPYAYTPTLGTASFLWSVNTLIFSGLVAFIFWVTSRAVRYDGFCTQYFFIAPFVEWLVSVPERLSAPKPVESAAQPKYFRKVVGVVVGFLAIFTYVGYQVPQSIGLPPKKEKLDVALIKNDKDLARHGQNIFFGKGQCALCHTLGAEPGRCPSLQNAGARLTREFIYESLTKPAAYVKLDFEEVEPKNFPARMPTINKPPIDLTEQEMLTVIAFVQSQGGKVTITPSELVEQASPEVKPAGGEAAPAKALQSRRESGEKGS
jgi:cytochrome bd-type quinol oxidase subunit 1/mono/diheme cytochrome c family protein